MTDQRIHQFKVFRGSSLAKTKRQFACSFISKPLMTERAASNTNDELGEQVDMQSREQLILQELQMNNHENNPIYQRHQLHNSLEDTTRNIVGNDPSLHRQQSLRYIYHEVDSVSQGPSDQQQAIPEIRIDESSIHLGDNSEWLPDQPKGELQTESAKQMRLSIERMLLTEEKLKLQLEKAELQRKKKQVELMMKEINMKRQTCSMAKSAQTLNDTREMTSSTIKSNIAPTETECKKRRSVRYRIEESEDTKKSNKQQLQKKLERLHKNQQLSRQMQARRAVLLETLWINLIKNDNEIRYLNKALMNTAFLHLKQINRVKALVAVVESVFSLSELISMGQAFIRIKKTEAVISKSKSSMPKRNIVLRLTRKQNKENAINHELYSGRVCDTEESRIFTDRNSTNQIGGKRSFEFQNGSFKIRQLKGAEMDSIIKAQLHINKQPKINRANSGERSTAMNCKVREIYLKTESETGNALCELNLDENRRRELKNAGLTKIQIKNISSMLKPNSTNSYTGRRLQ